MRVGGLTLRGMNKMTAINHVFDIIDEWLERIDHWSRNSDARLSFIFISVFISVLFTVLFCVCMVTAIITLLVG